MYLLIVIFSFFSKTQCLTVVHLSGALSHLYAIVPPLSGWCLRLLILSDLTEVRLPP